MNLCSCHQYCTDVLKHYTQMPHTPERPRALDRQLAARLYDRGIPVTLVQAAFVLASARRLVREPDAPPLPAIRSFAYFLPIIEELILQPLSPDYIDFLRAKIAAEITAKKQSHCRKQPCG